MAAGPGLTPEYPRWLAMPAISLLTREEKSLIVVSTPVEKTLNSASVMEGGTRLREVAAERGDLLLEEFDGSSMIPEVLVNRIGRAGIPSHLVVAEPSRDPVEPGIDPDEGGILPTEGRLDHPRGGLFELLLGRQLEVFPGQPRGRPPIRAASSPLGNPVVDSLDFRAPIEEREPWRPASVTGWSPGRPVSPRSA